MDDDPPDEEEPRPFLTLVDGLWFGFVQATVWSCFGVGAVTDSGALRLLGVWVWCGTFFLGFVWVLRYPWRRRTALPWLLMAGPTLGCVASGLAVAILNAVF